MVHLETGFKPRWFERNIIRQTKSDVLERLHIAEGLETALGAMSNGLRPMWATGSTATGGADCGSAVIAASLRKPFD